MKSKILIFLAVTAVITLSFTFSSVKKSEVHSKEITPEQQANNAPAGGFVSEDKF